MKKQAASKRTGGRTPPPALVSDILKVVAELGSTPAAAKVLGLSRPTVDRLAGALTVRDGTILLAERALADYASRGRRR
jgi:hypothetical protein